jgi:arginine exporter protein ArgO
METNDGMYTLATNRHLNILCNFFRAMRRARSQMVLLHLSLSLLAVDILVIGGIDKVHSPPYVCKTIAASLLYFLLVAFAWMLVEAVLQYLKFVKVFNTYTSKFMMKAALPSYGEFSTTIVSQPFCCTLTRRITH